MPRERQSVCLILTLLVFTLLSWVNAAAEIDCSGCHGTRSPVDYRPLDDSSRNYSTGGFQGNHRTHVGSPLNTQACAKCHPGSNSYTSDHRDGLIKVAANINNSNIPARYRNLSSAFPQTPEPQLGSCANVNCHFERDTPTWGGPIFVYPADCSICHGAPPSGGDTGAAGSHARHDLYFPGTGNCQVCHEDYTAFGHATSAGRPLVVKPRYPANSSAGTYDGPVSDYFPKSQTNAFGKCSNFYCHSDGTSVAAGSISPFDTPLWGGGALSCTSCHSSPPAYQNGSPKRNSHQPHGNFNCSQCHSATTQDGLTVTLSGTHVNYAYDVTPGTGVSFSYAFENSGGTCSNINCHFGGTATWGSTLQCSDCHGNMNQPPHFNNVTSGAYPASYVTTNISCNACHTMHGDTVNQAARLQWAQTGKGSILSPAWTDLDFKVLGSPAPSTPANSVAQDCVRCHTTTGYINYVTDSDGRGALKNITAWGVSSDKTKEVQACNTCHLTPFDSDNSRRLVAPLTGYYNYSSFETKKVLVNITYIDRGESNICMQCHSPRAAGETLASLATKVGQTGGFWTNASFVDPHFMPASGIMLNKTGYIYRPPSAYTPTGIYSAIGHFVIGGNYSGPCVSCHMSSADKHQFKVVSKDAGGIITSILTVLCAGCHSEGSSIPALSPQYLQSITDNWKAALDAVGYFLQTSKNILYQGNSPYFFYASGPNQGAPVMNWGDAATMGAAFNMRLIKADIGSYAHNPQYTKRILYDTIDYLDDGMQNNSVGASLNALVNPPFDKTKAIAYLLVNGNRP